jgi:predicted transcriptional regulator
VSKKVPHHPAMTAKEIADKLGVSEESVKSTLKKAIKKLRDGRAIPIRELVVARNREARRQLPKIVEGCIC